jgi:hypothetical protein
VLYSDPWSWTPEHKSLGVTFGRAVPDNLRSTFYSRNIISSSRNRIQFISMYDYNTESITMLLQQVDHAFGGVARL